MKKLIIDADSLCFHPKSIATKEEAIEWIEYKIEKIIEKTKITECQFYLTIGKNIRYEIYPEYKANRKGDKPQFTQELKQYLIDQRGAIFNERWEADDLVCDEVRDDYQCVLASIDKDLLYNVTGEHYNLYTNEYIQVTDLIAYNHFYTQIIIGDATDNIKPLIPKFGKAKIQKCLDNSFLSLKELGRYLCHRQNINYENRYRLLYCGKNIGELGEYVFEEIENIEKIIKGEKIKVNKQNGYKFLFGKYKGKTFEFVYNADKQYFIWAYENVDSTPFKKAINAYLRESGGNLTNQKFSYYK